MTVEATLNRMTDKLLESVTYHKKGQRYRPIRLTNEEYDIIIRAIVEVEN